jgi:hypothetical protein
VLPAAFDQLALCNSVRNVLRDLFVPGAPGRFPLHLDPLPFWKGYRCYGNTTDPVLKLAGAQKLETT